MTLAIGWWKDQKPYLEQGPVRAKLMECSGKAMQRNQAKRYVDAGLQEDCKTQD